MVINVNGNNFWVEFSAFKKHFIACNVLGKIQDACNFDIERAHSDDDIRSAIPIITKYLETERSYFMCKRLRDYKTVLEEHSGIVSVILEFVDKYLHEPKTVIRGIFPLCDHIEMCTHYLYSCSYSSTTDPDHSFIDDILDILLDNHERLYVVYRLINVFWWLLLWIVEPERFKNLVIIREIYAAVLTYHAKYSTDPTNICTYVLDYCINFDTLSFRSAAELFVKGYRRRIFHWFIQRYMTKTTGEKRYCYD